MASIKLFVNSALIGQSGKDTVGGLSKDDFAVFAGALTTSHVGSKAWRNLAKNPRIAPIVGVMDASFAVSLTEDGEEKLTDCTVGKIAKRLALIPLYDESAWGVATGKGEKTSEDGYQTDVDSLLSRILAGNAAEVATA